jgi:hypothetical protein
MAKLIPGPIVVRQAGETEVESEGCDYGVRFDDGHVYEANDEKDARETVAMTTGTLVVREVFTTAWAEVA